MRRFGNVILMVNFCFEFLQELLKYIEKLYQTLEKVFHLISKYLEVGLKKKKEKKKNSAMPCLFYLLFDFSMFWNWMKQSDFLVSDLLLEIVFRWRRANNKDTR